MFVKSIFTAKKVVKKFKPDIVIGFGGYPSASVVEAAYRLGYKTMIHEQNLIIGLTNKILIKFTCFILHFFIIIFTRHI